MERSIPTNTELTAWEYYEAELKWLEIEDRIAECERMAANADSAVIRLDPTLELRVQPNSPVRYYYGDRLGESDARFITEEFTVTEAAMRLKRDGRWEKPVMVASNGLAADERLIHYRFNPFEHNILAWRAEMPENPRRPENGIHAATDDNGALRLTIY